MQAKPCQRSGILDEPVEDLAQVLGRRTSTECSEIPVGVAHGAGKHVHRIVQGIDLTASQNQLLLGDANISFPAARHVVPLTTRLAAVPPGPAGWFGLGQRMPAPATEPLPARSRCNWFCHDKTLVMRPRLSVHQTRCMAIDLPAPATGFSSDNSAGTHPLVLEALARANAGHALAYGNDPFTAAARLAFDELFGRHVETLFVWNGTGGNVLALATLQRPGGAVVCTDSAHLHVDETGAPERVVGTKLLTVPHANGKLLPHHIASHAAALGVIHHAQPCTVSITQATEYGTVYSPAEIATICDEAHRHGMKVHLDGARIANAACALGGSVEALRSFTVEAGVDVVTFGGTKNGMMYGEAVVFLDPALAAGAQYLRKQVTQLPSKMRYVAAQFSVCLQDGLWLRTAAHSNAMAARLYEALADIQSLAIDAPEANSLYPTLAPAEAAALQAWAYFYPWDAASNRYRWMTAWDTTPEDVDRFAAGVRSAAGRA